jgi:flagellar assembly protein FliH
VADKDNIKTLELLDELLKREDPALIGVKKILKNKKKTVTQQSPFQKLDPEIFNQTTSDRSEENTTIFSDDEKQVIELQKEIIALKEQIQELEIGNQKAIEEAYNTGVEEGKNVQAQLDAEEIQTKILEVSQEANNNMIEILQRDLDEREKYFESLSEELLTIIFTTVKQIIQREIKIDSDIVLSVVKRALFYVADKRTIDIRVNPEDKPKVEELIESFSSSGERYGSVSVIADESIDAGGTIIESTTGIVDAKIDTLTREIESEIRRVWNDSVNSED